MDKLTTKDTIYLSFSSANFFRTLFKDAFRQLDPFLHEQSNFKSVTRLIPPFDEGDQTTVTIMHPLYKRVDGKTVGVKIGGLVPVPLLKVQVPPSDGSQYGTTYRMRPC